MFYELFKRVCLEKGVSPSAVALAAGMSKANVTNWKNGANPRLDTIASLAQVLNLPITSLLESRYE